MAADVTLVITACGREALLRRTLESFREFNTHPVSECILIEDSGRAGCNEHLKPLLPFPVRTLYNPRNLGQIISGFDRILVPELNMGQLLFLLRARYSGDNRHFISFSKVQGRPFTISELVERIKATLA